MSPADAPDTTTTPVGRDVVRIDGPLKVSGRARYSSDFHFDNMLHAVPVCAQVATGSIASVDTDAAKRMPGVRKIYTRENIGTFYRVPKKGDILIDEHRPPFEDDVIRYYGQYVAMVVGDTLEQATAAAVRVKVDYKGVKPPDVRKHLEPDQELLESNPDGWQLAGKGFTIQSNRGDVDAAFAAAPVKIDQTYTTPIETHNPIELHASVAVWDGHAFTLYETTQAIMNYRAAMAQMLGVPEDNVRIITEYLGSGFGDKLWMWPHALLAAAAARDLKRPIKLVITRKMMFHDVGHRPTTQQRMRLGAKQDGTLVALRQDYLYQCARNEDYKEDCGEDTTWMWSTPNLRVTSSFARRDIGTGTSMRGPGAVPGLYAVEAAMDELALALKMDPVQLRLRNEPKIDEGENVPFSSRHMKECLTRGAERFGWSRRKPGIGAMRESNTVVGWGMACCSWMAARWPSSASVMLNADGTVRVASGTQDIGTGTYTVLAQMVADAAGVDVSKVKVEIGDTRLPPGPLSGGSMATGSLVPAALGATQQAVDKLLTVASQQDQTFANVAKDDFEFRAGRVFRKGTQEGRPFADVLKTARMEHVEGKADAAGTLDEKKRRFATHSYGAHFVEVGWQPQIARLRVNRVVTVIDAGRIINPLTGRNQIEGAIVMGVGMALFEESHYDPRNGMIANSNLADYIVPTHADSPQIEVEFLDYPDFHFNALGARGIGEIGLAGFAAAVTNAVYHATGVRVRDLPIHIEDLLHSTVV